MLPFFVTFFCGNYDDRFFFIHRLLKLSTGKTACNKRLTQSVFYDKVLAMALMKTRPLQDAQRGAHLVQGFCDPCRFGYHF